jgi:hypothetical protein
VTKRIEDYSVKLKKIFIKTEVSSVLANHGITQSYGVIMQTNIEGYAWGLIYQMNG